MIRHWRILNVDDQYQTLEVAILKELLEKPKSRLAPLGISYGHDLEPHSYEVWSPTERYQQMMKLLEQGHFSLGLRLVSISHAWEFIKKAAEKDLRPDLCFVDVKLDDNSAFDSSDQINVITREIEAFFSEIPQSNRELVEAFSRTTDEFKQRGGLYLVGKIRRAFSSNPPPIIVYSESDRVHTEMLPLMYMGGVEIWPKQELFDDRKGTVTPAWKSLLKDCQRRMIANGIVSQNLIGRAVNDLKNLLLGMTKRTVRSRTLMWDQTKLDRDTVKAGIKNFLSLPIGGESPDQQWTIASFFALQLESLLADGTTAYALLENLDAILDLVYSVDYCQALTSFMLGTPFVYAGHINSQKYKLHPSSEMIRQVDWEDRTVRKRYIDRIISGWDKLPEELRREREIDDVVGVAVRECHRYLEDPCNQIAYDAAKKAVYDLRPTLSTDLFDVVAKFKSWEGCDENTLNCLYYCRPGALGSSPLVGLIKEILSHNHNQQMVGKWHPDGDSTGGRFIVQIINFHEVFPHSKLLDSAFFNQHIGGLRQTLSRANGWVRVEIHADGKRRNPHKLPYPEVGEENNASPQSTGNTIFELSVYCVRT